MLELLLPDPSSGSRQVPARAATYPEDDRPPLAAGMGHTNMLGEYDLTNEKLQDNTGVVPPKSTPSVIPENWEPPKR